MICILEEFCCPNRKSCLVFPSHMLKTVFQTYTAFTNITQVLALHFKVWLAVMGGEEQLTGILYCRKLVFQYKTKKIPPNSELHIFINISCIKLTGSSSLETFIRKDITRKDTPVVHAQVPCVFWGALGHMKHPHETTNCSIGYIGKWVAPGPRARSQAGLPGASWTALDTCVPAH